MDDIFEQMLSTSPWEDGVGMNRATWDAMNNVAMDSTMDVQSLPKMSTMPLMGGLQEDNERMRTDGTMDHSQEHGVHDQPGLQPGQGYGGDHQGNLNEDPRGTAANNAAAKPRVRARRGQATDPHSIAERNRRERIAERLRALQELVPDSNKTDKASMLDEIIGYVKFLQMQVKCLSMCRLGNAGAAVPLLADLPMEGAAGSFLAAANLAQAQAQAHGGLGTSQDGMALAERQVAQLMDEDMSAAMQYLQSKGLCLMPISLATAISSTGARQEPLASKAPDVMKQAMDTKGASPSNNGGGSMVPSSMTGKEKAADNPVQTTDDSQKDNKCG